MKRKEWDNMFEKKALSFLEELSNSFGPSGFEHEPTRIVKKYIEKYADDVSTDKLGSLLFKKRGSSERPVVLIPGHVDEVGFVVTGINKQGYITFTPVGGWVDQVLLGQRVIIRTKAKKIFGVIAAKPPHLLPPEEQKKLIRREKMCIDIGCSNKREAEKMGVRIGDPIVPDSRFSILEKTVVKNGRPKGRMQLAIGKAFDDRVGAFISAEVIRHLKIENIKHPNTVVGAATVQEEVGLRGARTTAYIVKPDVCLVAEVDIAGDVPGIEPHEAQCKIGCGPAILTFDKSMIPNQPLKELVIETAKKHKIPYQLSTIARGGTDAGVIHITHAGCPSIVLGVPTRHIHSHVGILSLSDVENCIKLITELTKILDEKTVEEFTTIV